MSNPPKGWTIAPLRDIAVLNPSQPSSPVEDGDLVSFIPMAKVEEETGRIRSPEVRAWREVKKGYTKFQEGDLLFAKITPCMENGKVAVAKDLAGGIGAGSTEFHVVRPEPDVNIEYLFYFLVQREVRRNARMQMKGAAGQLRVPTSFLESVDVPVAPTSEQGRIVGEIEKQFSRLDAATAALKRVQANLTRYRASVLKAACEGRLVPTEAEVARKEGREYEPADRLLERILNERRARWEVDTLAKMISSGKPPKDDGWKRRYREPTGPSPSGLPMLPQGWCWATWDQLSNWVTYGFTRPVPHTESGIPIVTARHIRGGQIAFEGCHRTTQEVFDDLSEKDRPRKNDILITKDGTIGRAAVVESEVAFCINQSVTVVWLRSCPCDRRYLLAVIESPLTQRPIEEKARGVAIQHLSITDFAKLPLPLPPLADQARISKAVSVQVSIVASLEREVETELLRCAVLRRAILRDAFGGELVSQDSADEPASALLERIRIGRASSADGRSSRTRRAEHSYA